jgi:hypothetical protein
MERGELPIRPSMARLILLVAHLAERGDDYAETLAAQAKGAPRRLSAKLARVWQRNRR